MAGEAFFGTWEVKQFNYINTTYTGEDHGLEGVKFKLDECGDVSWNYSEDLNNVPLFSCDTYELYTANTSDLGMGVLRFGAYAGHVIEFLCEMEPSDTLTLTCEYWCMIHCKRVKETSVESQGNYPFSLLPALEDGYFSDITITSGGNSRKFPVHSTIVQLVACDLAWQTQPTPLSGLPETVLGTILHFLYTQCLPEDLDEETAEKVVATVVTYPCLSKLNDMCLVYLKNNKLKQQIINLVNDMHLYLNIIIDRYHSDKTQLTINLIDNPEVLCHIVKQSVQDMVVVGVKLLLLCDLFTKRKHELSREERHEIIRYAKVKLPVFLMQLHKFLLELKNTFNSMSAVQRQEIATYLVPEIEIILDTISMLIIEAEKVVEVIIQGLVMNETNKTKSSVGDKLRKSLGMLLNSRESSKLEIFHEHITASLVLLLHKKDNFKEMSLTQKIRSVSRNLEQLVDELPHFLQRLDEIITNMDEQLEWKEFQFCFKVGTSKISGILQKLIAGRDRLQDILTQLCELIQRDAFTQTLFHLSLIPENLTTLCEGSQKPTTLPNQPNQSIPISKPSSTIAPPSIPFSQLNLVKSLCSIPSARDSQLSLLCLQLLKSGIGTDMEFEVVYSNTASNGSNQEDQTLREHEGQEGGEEDESCVIRAHRVIVAARCDWFRRALLSGMREAIDKKIVIHDTTPALFRIFLEYLYSGRLRETSLTTEQLSELLLLSDRYQVDSLKLTCENALQSYLDQDSVLYFFSMADQFNAQVLRNATLQYISDNEDLTKSDLFAELPVVLQAEIIDYAWQKKRRMKINEKFSKGEGEGDWCGTHRITSELKYVKQDEPLADGNGTEEVQSVVNRARLDRCLIQVRDILGEDAPREKLVEVILAADYNVGRAINYFLSNNSDDTDTD